MSTQTKNKTETSFVTKVIVIAVAVGALLTFLMPNTDKLSRFDTPANRLVALSFVQNPEALYMISEMRESDNRIDLAIREMRLAIGLLEMHNADAAILRRYRERLHLLSNKK
jgi:hypothetical protein